MKKKIRSYLTNNQLCLFAKMANICTTGDNRTGENSTVPFPTKYMVTLGVINKIILLIILNDNNV